MAQGWKTVRVFISSTFRDMQSERDWLVKRVFPALRQRLEPFRIHLIDIDLRWGITREQADNDQVLGLCLQQIGECRPFFLGLLGERYGWVPSAFPADVGVIYGLTQAQVGKSVTELEILHGVLNDPSMHGRALFCLRSPAFLENIIDTQRRAIYTESPTIDEVARLGHERAESRAADRRERLRNLKNRIRSLSRPMALLDGYACHWNGDLIDPVSRTPGRVDGMEEFGNWVIERLEQAILTATEFQDHFAAVGSEIRDVLSEERAFHDQFIQSRTRVYVERPNIQIDLTNFANANTTHPCLVAGPSGSGKSAALSHFVNLWRRDRPQEPAICHFVGASPRSTGLRDVLRHLCAELNRVLGLDEELEHEINRLVEQMRNLMNLVPSNRRIVVVLDALNQLDLTDNAHSLHWLPTQVPAQVRLIVSCIDDLDRTQQEQSVMTAMAARQPHQIVVGDLTTEERWEIIREVPSIAAKTLDQAQIDLLLSNESTRNPLFLLVALEELRGFGSFEQLNAKIASLPQFGDTLTAIFQQVIRRLAMDFDATTVRDILTLLNSARMGLSERELLDLISGENISFDGSAGDLFPILRQLRSYLQSRGPLLDFFHRHLARAVAEEFFAHDPRALVAAHGKLAEYFRRRADPCGDQTWLGEDDRPFVELAFHVARSNAAELPSLLFDFKWLRVKTSRRLVYELLDDFGEAVVALPKEDRRMRALAAVAGAIQLSTNVILADAGQLAGQLVGRLIAAQDARLQALCRQIVQLAVRPCLIPRSTALATPDGPLLRTLEGHRDGVTAVAVRPSGAHAVSASTDRTLRVWDLDSGITRNILQGDSGWAEAVAITPDGKRVVSGGTTNRLTVWDIESGRPLRTLDGHTDWVTSVALTPDGMIAVSGSRDSTVRVWDVESGSELRTLLGHERPVNSVGLIANGSRVVSGSSDCTLRLWDVNTGREQLKLVGHRDSVRAVAVTTDGHRVVSASKDGSVRVWDLATGSNLRTKRTGDYSFRALALMNDGWRAVIGTANGVLRVWDLENGDDLGTMEGHGHAVNAVAALPDGGRLVSASTDGTLMLWDVGACRRDPPPAVANTANVRMADSSVRRPEKWFSWGLGRIFNTGRRDVLARTFEAEERPAAIRTIAVTPDGKHAISASETMPTSAGSVLRIWDVRTGREVRKLEGGIGEVNGIAITPDGTRVVCGSTDTTVKVWNLATGNMTWTLTGHVSQVLCVALTPDGARALSGSADKTLKLWDLRSGRYLRTLAGHAGMVRAVVITPDGRHAVSADDLTLLVWDLESGRPMHELAQGGFIKTDMLAERTKATIFVAITPGGKHVVSASLGAFNKWEIETGRILGAAGSTAHDWGGSGRVDVDALAVTPDGKLAITNWARAGALYIWDLESCRGLRRIRPVCRWSYDAVVMPNAVDAVSASDRSLTVWRIRAGVAMAVFTADSDIRACAVTPDGKTIVAGDALGRVHFVDYLE